MKSNIVQPQHNMQPSDVHIHQDRVEEEQKVNTSTFNQVQDTVDVYNTQQTQPPTYSFLSQTSILQNEEKAEETLQVVESLERLDMKLKQLLEDLNQENRSIGCNEALDVLLEHSREDYNAVYKLVENRGEDFTEVKYRDLINVFKSKIKEDKAIKTFSETLERSHKETNRFMDLAKQMAEQYPEITEQYNNLSPSYLKELEESLGVISQTMLTLQTKALLK